MKTSIYLVRPLAIASVASIALLASCSSEEEPATENGAVSPSRETSPSSSNGGGAIPSQLPADASNAAPVTQTAGLMWDVPSGWVATVPEGVMRKAEYTVASPDGSASSPAECVVYYFGPAGQGGNADTNVQRWSQQVLDSQGAPSEPNRMEFEVGELHVTTVAYVGTYQSGMPGGPQTPMPQYMLLGAIIEGGPEGSIFIKMTGPADVVDANREAWEMLVRSARKAQ